MLFHSDPPIVKPYQCIPTAIYLKKHHDGNAVYLADPDASHRPTGSTAGARVILSEALAESNCAAAPQGGISGALRSG